MVNIRDKLESVLRGMVKAKDTMPISRLPDYEQDSIIEFVKELHNSHNKVTNIKGLEQIDENIFIMTWMMGFVFGHEFVRNYWTIWNEKKDK